MTLFLLSFRCARAARALLLVLLFVAAAATHAAPAGVAPVDDGVTLNFVNADIDAVVKAVAEITGRNFVVDPKVKGVVNIVSARPVPRSLVYPTLLSALRLQGFTAVESDGMVKIVPEADAKQQGGPVVTGRVAAGGDRLVTQVITLRYESASQLVPVLRPLITPNNTIAAFPAANALVITDYADNLRRIERIVASLDQPPSGETIVVPVRHASALDLVPMLNRLLLEPAAGAPGAPADAQQRIALVADPRSNSVLIRAENPARASRARALIEQLDTPGRVGGNIFIVYLRNADAARVAQTLRALLSGGESTPTPTTSGLSATSMSPLAGAIGTIPGNALPTAPSLATTGGAPSGAGFSGGGATIQADTANNALLIAAPEPVYNNLRAVIEKLDIRRAQVFVEALIAEVNADKAAEFGIQWQYLSNGSLSGNSTSVVGGTNFGARGAGTNIIDASGNLTSVAPGLNLGVVRGSITIPGIGTITNLAFLARALETNANANILSTPTLLTLDNEEAKIVVGENVPFITGQYATTGNVTGVAPFQTIERRDVGLTLRVKPQITEGGSVRLSIYQEVSRVEDTTNTAGIITNKRSLESSVVIDDSQIVVLGGLMQDSFTDSSDKVPLIGDVPVVGQLFRYDNRKRSKTNLLIFLKPTVVRNGSTAAALTGERYDYLLREQERLYPAERFFWKDPSVPELPPLPAPPASAPATAPPSVPPANPPGAATPAR
ncbi:MAG TPA: type II secretion system secretin GspD [Casimicrobiaceae bacterium]|nr:type II secretion system secretin GspD [Casimicrobiaceae bacterium]